MDDSAKLNHNLFMSRTLRTVVKPEVQSILDHFCYSFDIRIILYTPDGEVLKVGMNRADSDYCRHVRKLYGSYKCYKMDETMRSEAAANRALTCYTCHAGLQEAIEPIYVRDVLIGYAMIGQFRASNRIAAHVLNDWNAAFGPTDEIKSSFQELPELDSVTQDHVLGLFRLIVEYAVSKELIAAETSILVEQVRSFIQSNIDRPVGADDAARALHKSPSTIYHAVKNHEGITFKQLVRKLQMNEADRIMLTEPEISIAQLADRLGFSDQFYFSRVYSKVRGYPPSKSRNGGH